MDDGALRELVARQDGFEAILVVFSEILGRVPAPLSPSFRVSETHLFQISGIWSREKTEKLRRREIVGLFHARIINGGVYGVNAPDVLRCGAANGGRFGSVFVDSA